MLPLPVAKLLDIHSEFFLNSPNTWPLTKIPTPLFHHQKGRLKKTAGLLQNMITGTNEAVSFGEFLFLQDFREFMFVDQAISTLCKGADTRLQSAGI